MLRSHLQEGASKSYLQVMLVSYHHVLYAVHMHGFVLAIDPEDEHRLDTLLSAYSVHGHVLEEVFLPLVQAGLHL